ncbi:DUF1499 domain-containing protein [Jannaschia sp. W003]|uniref:DUF1499 domain-containing protein n=1 Tax=Jannaschia sp. W003 TaxID=2867012 RepID=UPI0021A52CB8|nr:DUF1499 domain-containing protein [Jannaschia sp. W003]UWQ20826.1 DUF1499 domain-containing protein [Jannaschia sp. W003]
MTTLQIALGALALSTLLALLFVRAAPLDPALWHADPFAPARSGRPNDALAGPGGERPALRVALPPAEALARLDAAATAEPRTVRLAGAPDEGRVTYVQRSSLVGYPDVVSVAARPDGAGAELAIWSRSRFGYADMGVNAARMDRWLGVFEGE